MSFLHKRVLTPIDLIADKLLNAYTHIKALRPDDFRDQVEDAGKHLSSYHDLSEAGKQAMLKRVKEIAQTVTEGF